MKHSLKKAMKSISGIGLVLVGIMFSFGSSAQTSIMTMGNDTICLGDSVMAYATSSRVSGVSFSWSDSLGSTMYVDTVSNDTAWLKPQVSTKFRVIGDSAGVADTAYKTIVVRMLPSVSIAISADTACVRDTISIKGSGAATYTYYRGTNIIGSGDSTLAIVASGDSLWVMGTDAHGCSSTAGKQVVTQALPTVNFKVFSNGFPSDDRFACAGQEFSITATPGHAAYLWTSDSMIVSGATDSVMTGITTTAANYNVRVIGTNGCVTNAVQLIRTIAQPAKYVTLNLVGNTDTVLCGGESRTAQAARCDYYRWSPASAIVGNDTTSPTVTLLPANDVTVRVIGVYEGCLTSEEITLRVSQLPTLTLVSQTSSPANRLCKGDPDTIVVNSNSSRIEWNTVISARTTKSFTYPKTTTFKITAFNDLDCTEEITVTSHVDTTCGDLNLNTTEQANAGIEAFYNSNAQKMVVNNSTFDGIAALLVYDLSGNELINSEIELQPNAMIEVDFSQFSTGAYLFRLQSAEINYSRKFIKQ